MVGIKYWKEGHNKNWGDTKVIPHCMVQTEIETKGDLLIKGNPVPFTSNTRSATSFIVPLVPPLVTGVGKATRMTYSMHPSKKASSRNTSDTASVDDAMTRNLKQWPL